MEIPYHLICLLRNLYEGQEATVRTGHGTMDWFKIGKGVQDCTLLPCLFNFYAGYIMQNARLDELQAGIKVAGRNISNLRYADCCCSVPKSRPTLWDPTDGSTPGFPVPHCLPDLTLTHVHWVGDAIQQSHSLSPPSPPALNLSQEKIKVFSNESALWFKVLELQFQHQPFQWIFRVDFL